MAQDTKMLLLVWNESQYGLKFYIIPDTEENRKILDLCNNYYIDSVGKRKGSDEAQEAIDFVSAAIVTQEMIDEVDEHRRYEWDDDYDVVGQWAPYFRGKHVCGPVGDEEKIVKVYTGGWHHPR